MGELEAMLVRLVEVTKKFEGVEEVKLAVIDVVEGLVKLMERLDRGDVVGAMEELKFREETLGERIIERLREEREWVARMDERWRKERAVVGTVRPILIKRSEWEGEGGGEENGFDDE